MFKNEVTDEEFKELYKELPVKGIAYKYKVSMNVIYKRAKKLGLNKDFAYIEELYELRVNCKWTFEELAELYEITTPAIQAKCKNNNFPKIDWREGIIET